MQRLPSLKRAAPVAHRGRHAFERLVLLHQDRVFSLALGLVGDPETARDVAQEAFCRALQGLQEFRRRSSFYTWVARITINLCINENRRKRVRGALSLFMAAPGSRNNRGLLGSRLASSQPEPDETLTCVERDAAVHIAVESLHRDLRQVVVLRDMQGLPYQEVAELLQIPIGTVRSRLHRARGILRERLSTWTEE